VRRAWCILVLLAATLLPVASAYTDVQAIPLDQYCARAGQEGVNAWEKEIMTHQMSIAQSLPAPTGLAVTESVVSQPPPPPRAEMIPMAPLPSHVWVPGQWVAQGQHWVWRPGRWQ
jgi:WXXGXW repeat (2 copies)